MKETTVKDLRIGNMVNLCFHHKPGWFPAAVTAIYASSIDTDTEDSDSREYYYEGIPLTEEWLVRMGFKERHIYEEVSEWNLGPYRIQTNVEFYIWMGIGDGVELKFVHQLQNLYFALTGEELKLA